VYGWNVGASLSLDHLVTNAGGGWGGWGEA